MRILKRVVVVVVVSFLIATLPGALWAESPMGAGGKSSYAVLKGGIYIPEAKDMNGQDANNGFVGRVGFGYYITPYFSVEAALGYQEFKANTGSVERRYQMFPLEAAGKLGLPLDFIEPYVTFGLGGYYVMAKAGNYEVDTSRVGFFGGVGVNFNLGNSVFVGVEARYLVLQASSPYYYSSPYHGGGYYYSGNSDVNLDGVIVTGNLGFRF
jgi:opacity protein-like surface antigen